MQAILDAVRAESLRMTVGEAVRRVTAFHCEHDMLERMAGHGYCPTLRVKDEPMGVEEGRDNHAVRVIRAWVLDGGFSYFDGSRVVEPLTRRLLAKVSAERERLFRIEQRAPEGGMKTKLFFRGYRLSRLVGYLKERAGR